MMQSKRPGVLYARIAGSLFLVQFAFWLYQGFSSSFLFGYGISIFVFLNIIYHSLGCMFGVLLLSGKNGKPLVIVTGFMAAFQIYMMVGNSNLSMLLDAVSWMVLFIAIKFSTVSAKRVQLLIAKVLCLLPAGLFLFELMVSGTIQNFIEYFSLYFKEILRPILSYIYYFAQLFFVGLWISSECNRHLNLPAKTPYAPVNRANASSQYTDMKLSAAGGADKLKTYKQLLDSGVITEEEFESMKQKLLD